MPLGLRRFIVEPWTCFMLYMSTLLGSLFSNLVSLFSHGTDAILPCPKRDAVTETDAFPLTDEQTQAQIEDFIGSISEDAVCDLASRYRGQDACTVVGRERGSFNVCFFVRFDTDNARWVVRVPLEPAVVDSWTKIQSEVATLRFIRDNTMIPVPNVRAFGTEAALIPGRSAAPSFLICDYIPGTPLQMKTLVEAPREARRRFYGELIDMLGQLYGVEFATAGSLMPEADGSGAVVGDILSLPANELLRYRPGLQSTTALTDGQYMAYHHRILSETFRLPAEDLSEDQVQMELFAIESLAGLIQSTEAAQSTGPFVLSHLDLRCHNMIVTEHLDICGIIDWEFSGTVPQRLFTPPPWLTGHDASAVWACPPRAPVMHCQLYPEFLEVLEEKSSSDGNCAKLWEEWRREPEWRFSLAQILRRPSCLMRLYYRDIFPRLFKDANQEAQVAEFFGDVANEGAASEAKRRVKQSICYTQYLKDQGLFVEDEESQWTQEFIAKAKEVLKK